MRHGIKSLYKKVKVGFAWLMDGITWLKGLVAASIGGTATALSAMSGASAFGHPLDWQQIGAVAVSSSFFSGMAYLKQSPIPDSVELKSISFEPQKTTVTTASYPQPVPPIDKIDK